MTKAERIFNETRKNCMLHISDWGHKTNPNGSTIGFNKLSYKDSETVSIRTINAVEKILEKKREYVKLDLKLNVISADRAKKETEILNMVESTIKNNRESINKFNEMILKES